MMLLPCTVTGKRILIQRSTVLMIIKTLLYLLILLLLQNTSTGSRSLSVAGTPVQSDMHATSC